MSAQSAPAQELRRLDQHELDAVCAKHDRLWTSKPGGARAVFAWKDLSGLDLRGKNLCDADLTGAVLADCQMQGIRLDHANLFGADLADAEADVPVTAPAVGWSTGGGMPQVRRGQGLGQPRHGLSRHLAEHRDDWQLCCLGPTPLPL